MKTIIPAAMLLSLAAAAPAQQSSPPAAGGQAGGLLGGLLGGGLPNVASTSAGNAAGLLSYCVKNNVLGGGGASSVLDRLAGRQGVTGSPGYTAGQRGQVQTGEGRALSLDGVKGQVKTQLCNLVLRRAQSFLPGGALR